MIDPALIKRFKFSEDDLKANREGVLSDSQQQKMQVKPGSALAGIGWIIAFMAAGVGCLALVDRSGAPVYLLVTGGFILYCLFIAWGSTGSKDSDLENKKVLSFCGVVSHERRLEYRVGRDRGLRTHTYLLVKAYSSQMEFQVSDTMFEVFENGRPYCLYYLPQSKRIISYELLSELPASFKKPSYNIEE